MKIALDCRMINHSGIGTFLKELVPRFLCSDHEFLLLGTPRELAEFEEHGGKVVPFLAPIYSVAEQVSFPRSVLTRCQVLFCPHYNIPITTYRNLIVVIHDLAHLALPHIFRGVAKRVYAHLFYRYAVRRAARIVTVSQFTGSELSRRLGVDPARIDVIPNGPGRTFPGSEELSLDRVTRYAVEPPYVLAVGNLKPHKNLAILVETIRRLRSAGHTALTLVLAGRGLPEDDTDESVFGCSKHEPADRGVILPGYVADEDMPALYHHASLFVLPSIYEGFGLPALEALRFGTLTLVSDSASLPEIIDDPDLRFSPRNPDELASKMSFFLTHQDLIQSKVAQQQQQAQRFSWDRSAQAFLEVMEKVAGKSRTR